MAALLGIVAFFLNTLFLAAIVGVCWRIGFVLSILPDYSFGIVFNNAAWAIGLMRFVEHFWGWIHGRPFWGVE